MSVCAHDVRCPGHGRAHDTAVQAGALREDTSYLRRRPLQARPRTVLLSVTNPDKDRRLRGKARRRARRAA